MPFDPTLIIGEVLGEPAQAMRNPVNLDYRCPFISSRCMKRSQGSKEPYPICSIWRVEPHKDRKIQLASVEPCTPKRELICICPKRFFTENLIDDIIKYCWEGEPPDNPRFVHEVKMGLFGNVDLVIADIDNENRVKQFVSVELQAIDITGSYFRAYKALINSEMLEEKVKFGFNFANVYKRFITQLIAKGYYHHHWNTKIIAVVQDVLLKDLIRRTNFPTISLRQANIIFLSYKFVMDVSSGRHNLIVSDVVGTQHTNLKDAVLYQKPPSRDAFCRAIETQLFSG